MWSDMTLKERVQIFFKYRQLLEENIEELTELVHLENGKTMGEARAEVLKSMELCEFAVSMPQIVTNEIQEVSKGVECRIERKPWVLLLVLHHLIFRIWCPIGQYLMRLSLETLWY